MSASNSGSSLFQPNSVKYSDKGTEPATGMSGNAKIQSRALIGKDGSTLLEATTGALDGASGVGSIATAVVTPITPDGLAQTSLAYNHLSGGYWSNTYMGFSRGMTLALHNNVAGVDPRNDVVPTNPVIKLRPDLAAQKIDGPAQAYTNAPVTFTGTVTELNGDVGAHANCVLSVNGQQVDKAVGIWVDAGRAVNCAFQTSFSSAGTYNVQLSVSNVVPGDWDTANNTAQTSIKVVDPTVQLGYSASGWVGTSQSSFNQTYTSPQWGYYSYIDNWNEYSGSAQIQGYTFTHSSQLPVQQMSVAFTSDTSTAGAAFTIAPNYVGPVQTYYQGTPYEMNCQQGFGTGTSASICAYSGSAQVHGYLHERPNILRRRHVCLRGHLQLVLLRVLVLQQLEWYAV